MVKGIRCQCFIHKILIFKYRIRQCWIAHVDATSTIESLLSVPWYEIIFSILFLGTWTQINDITSFDWSTGLSSFQPLVIPNFQVTFNICCLVLFHEERASMMDCCILPSYLLIMQPIAVFLPCLLCTVLKALAIFESLTFYYDFQAFILI
jgi:hypothetical protein